MSVLVDTGVLYADHDEAASRHVVADTALDEVYTGALGQPYVSDYVYDEAVTLTLRRSGRFETAKTIGERLRGAGPFPDAFVLVRISESVFDDAIGVFERYDDQSLSFDDDFDGIVNRTDPADLVE